MNGIVFSLLLVMRSSSLYNINHKTTALLFSRGRSTQNNNDDIISELVDDTLPSISSLIQRSQKVRKRLYGDTNSLPEFIHGNSRLLSYPSSTYNMEIESLNSILRRTKKKISVQRGYCNWLIPRTIMIGQYPGMTPETYGPTMKECNLHIKKMVQDANISMFCCLQTEVPSQDDDIGWKDKSEVYMEPEYVRKEFPRPFTRYGMIAQSFAESQKQLTFIHNPIQDLNVPNNESLLSLLSQLLQHLEDDNQNTIYLHCWGGRGRAGLIGSCLASLIFPELSSKEILDWVQRGYDTRLGAEYMPEGLKRSPQTQQQRSFVREFVHAVNLEGGR